MISDSLIKEIGSEVGTPAYVYDGCLLEAAAGELSGTFKEFNPHYSFKANPSPEIVRTIARHGFGAEVASEFEAATALNAGFSPREIMYDGPAKTSSEILKALSGGISHFNAESAAEVLRIGSALKKLGTGFAPDICLRVNPKEASSAGEIMTGRSSRFGIDEEILAGEAERIRSSGPDIRGIHLYVGSQIMEEDKIIGNFKKGLSILAALLDKRILGGKNPPVFVFGPGLGFPYDGKSPAPAYGLVSRGCLEAAEKFRNRYDGLHIKIEIGRALTAGCGIYLTRVIETKVSRNRFHVLVDGGIHHFMRYALTGSIHRARPVGKKRGEKITAVIGGATCTPYDVLTVFKMKKPEPGDLLALLDAGAYGWSMGMSNFLSRPTPPEIIAERDGWRVIRERGICEDPVKKP